MTRTLVSSLGHISENWLRCGSLGHGRTATDIVAFVRNASVGYGIFIMK